MSNEHQETDLNADIGAVVMPMPRPPSRLRLWGVSAAVICAFLAIDFATPLIFNHTESEYLVAVIIGVFLGEITLIAFWAALGPGNIVVRIPWSLLLGMFTWYAFVAGGRIMEGYFPREEEIFLVAILLGGVMIAQIPFWIAKLFFRWRLVDPSGRLPSPQEERQFNIRHLLLAMFLVSVALSPARSVLPPGPGVFHARHIAGTFFAVIPIAVSLLVTIPSIWGTFVAEEPGTIIMLLLGMPFYCLLLAFVEFGVLTAIFGAPPSIQGRLFFGVWLLNLTPGVTVFGTLLIYRTMGFRLIRRPRRARRPLAGFAIENRAGQGGGE